MKYLVSGDFHTNENRRLEDFIQNMETLEEASRIHKPDVYINTGDVFDKRKPTPKELKVIANHLLNIVAKKKLVVIGNHEKIDDYLSALDWAMFPNVYVKKTFCFKDGDVKFYVAHRTVTEAKVGPKDIHLDAISYKKLPGDIIILGHIHKPQVISKTKPFCFYSGSIERINFGEYKEEKCYWILTVEKNKVKVETFPFKLRPMSKVVYNLDNKKIYLDEKEITDKKELEKATNGAILKVSFIGKKEVIARINVDKLYKIFGKAYKVDFSFEYSNVKGEYKNGKTKGFDDNQIVDYYCKKYDISELVKKVALKIVGLK